MKRILSFSFVGVMAAVSLTPADALAWNTNKPATVTIVNGYGQVPVGTWTLELNQYVDSSGYAACSYFVQWVNAAPLRSTANLFLDELMVPGYFDCDLNSLQSFYTVLFNSPDFVSVGFDKFNQKRVVQNLILSEDPSGMASGVITFNSNFPYPIVVVDP